MGKYNTDCKRQDITRRHTRAFAADVDAIAKLRDGAWIDARGRDVSKTMRLPDYEGERVGPVVNRCPFCNRAMRATEVRHVERHGTRDLVTHNMRCDGCASEHESRSWHRAGSVADPARPVAVPKRPAVRAGERAMAVAA